MCSLNCRLCTKRLLLSPSCQESRYRDICFFSIIQFKQFFSISSIKWVEGEILKISTSNGILHDILHSLESLFCSPIIQKSQKNHLKNEILKYTYNYSKKINLNYDFSIRLSFTSQKLLSYKKIGMKEQRKDEQFFLHSSQKNRYLETENCSRNQIKEQKFGKWSENTLYDDVKRRIHSKIKTEVITEDFCMNTPKIKHDPNLMKRIKSKLTISTLQIAIQPIRRVKEDTFPIGRKILHQPQQLIEVPSCQPLRIVRRMSDKIVREASQSIPLFKKQKTQTCRKNTKSITQFSTTLKSFKSNQLIKTQSSSFEKVNMKNVNKREKSKSQISKSNSTKNVTNAKTNPLMFFFRTKNNMKQAERQMSIKKIRIKSKCNEIFN